MSIYVDLDKYEHLLNETPDEKHARRRYYNAIKRSNEKWVLRIYNPPVTKEQMLHRNKMRGQMHSKNTRTFGYMGVHYS